MKRIVLLFSVLFCIMTTFFVPAQHGRKSQSQRSGSIRSKEVPNRTEAQKETMSASTVKSITAQEAYKKLKDLSDQQKLRTLLDYGSDDDLRPENCFGLMFPNNVRLIGESRGEYYSALLGDQGKSYPMIGHLYSDADFLVGDKAFSKGSYALVARDDIFGIHAYYVHEDFKLSSKLDETLFKGHNTPKFSLVQDGTNIFLVLVGNKLPIKLR